MMDKLAVLVVVPLALAFYFLPAIVAGRRGHRNQIPIFIVNLFFGWTVIGWAGTLAWAASDNVKPPETTT